jgi:N4-bis(aminopropyl)spermidine synthase
MNAVSDVVENRPRPLRQFDQIYMKSGDMLRQTEIVASWAEGKRLAFIGDGDGISLTVAHFKKSGILHFGPTNITVFDFDERIVNSVQRFADRLRVSDILQARLYNVIDPFPQTGEHDYFYTNPPWGQHSDGESVAVFVQRGMEAIGFQGQGMVVIADDPELEWPQQVLFRTQTFAMSQQFFVSRMMPRESLYHLFDEHELIPSCNLIFSSLPGVQRRFQSEELEVTRRKNFYGRECPLEYRYVRELSRPDYGKASDGEYKLERVED